MGLLKRVFCYDVRWRCCFNEVDLVSMLVFEKGG